MNISRIFLVTGALWLLVGIVLGMYMGGSQDFTLAPVHAHINLLGFTLMTIFGIAYRVIPDLAQGRLAMVHFWLHEVGVAVSLVCLFLFMSGVLPAAEKILPVAETAVFIGIIAWTVNLMRKIT
jgi:ABC-type lipoprotein release transport system permease subunit